MIRVTTPRGKPLREWVCVYCDAHGPADSEEAQVSATIFHLLSCEARKRTDMVMERARAALEAK